MDMKFLRERRRAALKDVRVARRRLRTAEAKFLEAMGPMTGSGKARARLVRASDELERRERELAGLDRLYREQKMSIYRVPRDRLDEVVIRRVRP